MSGAFPFNFDFDLDDESDAWLDRLAQAEAAERELRLRRFYDVRRVERGGQGIIYRARDAQTGLDVALKRLPSQRRRDAGALLRLDRECAAGRSLQHPNIVRVLGVELFEGESVLVMEWVDGEPLDRYVERCHPDRSPRAIGSIFGRLANALGALHAAGYVHRDVKPDNVLVDAAGTPRLIDLGLARFMGGERPLTHAREFLGTPGYAAPEQRADPRRADSRSDIYALGVMLHESLLGRLPAEPGSLDRDDARRLPPSMAAVITRAIATDPADRYRDARRFAADVARARRGGRLAWSSSEWSRRTRAAWRHFGPRWLMGLSLVVVALLSILPKEPDRVTASVDPWRAAVASVLVPPARAAGDAQRAWLADVSRRTGEALGNAPEVELELRPLFRDVAYHLGDRESICRETERLVELLRLIYGDRHHRTLVALNQLGVAQKRAGRLIAAEQTYRNAIALARQTGDAELERVVLCNLTVLLSANGRESDTARLLAEIDAMPVGEDATRASLSLIQARSMSQSSIAIDELRTAWRSSLEKYGKDHPETLSAANSLGVYLAQAGGDIDEARSLIEDAMRRAPAVFGDRSPICLRLRQNLIMVEASAGDVASAVIAGRDLAVEIDDRLGTQHPAALAARCNLAGYLMATGCAEAAIHEYEQLMARFASLPPDHPAPPIVRTRYGALLVSLGRNELAERVLWPAVESLEARSGDRLFLVEATCCLGRALWEAGDRHLSIELLRRAVEVAVDALGADQDQRVLATLHLARALASQGEAGLAEAEALLLAVAKARSNTCDNVAVEVEIELAQIWRDTGRVGDAVALLRHLEVSRCDAGYGEHAWLLAVLGTCLAAIGEADEGVSLCRRGLDLRLSSNSPQYASYLRIRMALADTLLQAGQRAEARGILEADRSRARAFFSPEHPLLVDYRRR